MAMKQVPMDTLPRAFMWEDGIVYVPHPNGTNAPPAALITRLVSLNILQIDKLPPGEDPNEAGTDQTKNAGKDEGDGGETGGGTGTRSEGGTGGETGGETAGLQIAPLTAENADAAAETARLAAMEAPQSVTDGGSTGGGTGDDTRDGAGGETTGQQPTETGGGGEGDQYAPDDELPDGFPSKELLNAAGYTTIGQIQLIDVTQVSGIGPATKTQIDAWIGENVT